MLYNFPTLPGSNDFVMRQYMRMLEGSAKIGQEFTEIWWQSWGEFWNSPQTLVRRNFDYMQEVLRPAEAQWQTRCQEVRLPQSFSQIIKFLDFSVEPHPSGKLIPTVILPPQAGHHSYIADYSAEQSQTQILRQSGLKSIYCVEWLPATQQTKHTTVEDYIAAVRHCIELVGGKANLVGDCQGGWFAAIFAALYPEMVNTLTVAGAPIDYQAGEGQIKQAVNYYAENFPDRGMSFYRSLVAMGNGVLDGRFLIMGFDTMRPGQTALRYMSLYRNIHDPLQLQRFREMKNWYDYTQNIAGDFYLWLVAHLFRDNELILGELVVEGRKVDLSQINCPIFLIGGTRDHVTPPEQVFAMTRYVSTPRAKIEEHLVDAGHIGLFMGKDILTNTWAPIGRKIEEYSIAD